MRHGILLGAAGLTFALAMNAGPAIAQVPRTFVSGHGSDANPCSLAAPCRSFQQAYAQTNAGGEITVLDPAGYREDNDGIFVKPAAGILFLAAFERAFRCSTMVRTGFSS